MVERRITGREITVGVLEGHGSICAFAPIEIRTPADTWYDFEHRYTAGGSEHVIPAELDADMLSLLQAAALRAHVSLGCRDFSRADFIVGGDGAYLLEVNTIPGMTPTSLFPDGAAHAGVDFRTLVSHLVRSPLLRNT